MKKTSESRTGRLLRKIFKIRSWIDFDRIVAAQRYIVRQCSVYFIPQEAVKKESFEEAQARLNLTDQDIIDRQNGLLRLSLIMLGVALAVFGYAIYNLWYDRYLAVLLCLMVMSLSLVLAFRYHFWYFQIQRRKLGCSLHEWFMQGLMGAKDE